MFDLQIIIMSLLINNQSKKKSFKIKVRRQLFGFLLVLDFGPERKPPSPFKISLRWRNWNWHQIYKGFSGSVRKGCGGSRVLTPPISVLDLFEQALFPILSGRNLIIARLQGEIRKVRKKIHIFTHSPDDYHFVDFTHWTTTKNIG